jgi:hypothetical protein
MSSHTTFRTASRETPMEYRLVSKRKGAPDVTVDIIRRREDTGGYFILIHSDSLPNRLNYSIVIEGYLKK